MSPLNRKLGRTIKTTRGQFIALVAIVMVGVVIFIAMNTAFYNLSRSQEEFYDDKNFADYYFHVVKAPLTITKQIKEINGIIQVTGRIQKDVPLVKDKGGRSVARLTSYPLPMEKEINQIHLLSGRLFDDSTDGVLVDPQHAQAKSLSPGDRLEIIVEGKKVSLSMIGTATGPEFIYPLKDASTMFPDPENFCIIMGPHEQVEQLVNMEGQINQVLVKLAPGADEEQIASKIEKILEPYGNLASYPRSDQLSNATMQMELDGLESSSRFLPMIFFILAAAIQFILLNRLIKSQRLEIGIMKGLGYSNRQIMLHFIGYALAVTTAGFVLGALLGIISASAIADMYALFFNLPESIGGINGAAVFWSWFVTSLLGVVSGLLASWSVIKIHPAEAMRPDPPRGGSRTWLERWDFLWGRLHTSWKMSVRSISRNRSRFAVTVLGVIAAVSIMILGLFADDSVDYMMDQHFTRETRYDYIVHFTQPVKGNELMNWLQWEEVYQLESALEVPVAISALQADEEMAKSEDELISGLEKQFGLRGIFNEDGKALAVPEEGILLSERTARKLGIGVGDYIRVESKLGIGPSRESSLKVVAVNKQLMGGGSFVSLETANRILQEKQLVSAVMLKVDINKSEALEKRLNDIPGVASVVSKDKEIDSIMRLMDSMLYFIGIMLFFSVILVLAIVYNSSIMGFNERKRELSSLRVMGLSEREVSSLLFKETCIQSALGIMLGLPAGRLLGELYMTAVNTDLFYMPVIIYPQTYLIAGLVAVGFVLLGHYFVIRKVKELDMVEVLKNRD